MPLLFYICHMRKIALAFLCSLSFVLNAAPMAFSHQPEEGIVESGGPSFTLTPNPVSGNSFSINIDFNASQYPDAVIIISDVLGKTIYQQILKPADYAEGRVRISVVDANLDKGVYFIQIKSGDFSKTQKLAIR